MAYISQSEEDRHKFISETGIAYEDVKGLLTTPEFLSGVLAYLLRDESLLMSFCVSSSVQPGDVETAWQQLGGREA